MLPVPQSLTISGSYADGYKVTLVIKETGKTATLDVSDRKKIYEENGVYKGEKAAEARGGHAKCVYMFIAVCIGVYHPKTYYFIEKEYIFDEDTPVFQLF